MYALRSLLLFFYPSLRPNKQIELKKLSNIFVSQGIIPGNSHCSQMHHINTQNYHTQFQDISIVRGTFGYNCTHHAHAILCSVQRKNRREIAPQFPVTAFKTRRVFTTPAALPITSTATPTYNTFHYLQRPSFR